MGEAKEISQLGFIRNLRANVYLTIVEHTKKAGGEATRARSRLLSYERYGYMTRRPMAAATRGGKQRHEYMITAEKKEALYTRINDYGSLSPHARKNGVVKDEALESSPLGWALYYLCAGVSHEKIYAT